MKDRARERKRRRGRVQTDRQTDRGRDGGREMKERTREKQKEEEEEGGVGCSNLSDNSRDRTSQALHLAPRTQNRTRARSLPRKSVTTD